MNRTRPTRRVFLFYNHMNRKTKHVAIQGVPGANHELAAREYFKGENVEVVPCLTFHELFAKVKANPSIYGIVAIENTLVGSILPNYTLLKDSGLAVIGEYKLRIKHDLMALPGQRIEHLKEVHSHPMALMQCEGFFRNYPHIKLIESEDTALSARDIAEQQTKQMGAIASPIASKLYNLEVLSAGIEDNKKNFTRFLIVSDRAKTEVASLIEDGLANKSSIAFSLDHSEGSLSKVLTILAFYNVNLTKIQSNPVVGHEWEYIFYIDLTFKSYTRYLQALDAIRPLCNRLRVLGEYAECIQNIHE